jgi:hypothetical protein
VVGVVARAADGFFCCGQRVRGRFRFLHIVESQQLNPGVADYNRQLLFADGGPEVGFDDLEPLANVVATVVQRFVSFDFGEEVARRGGDGIGSGKPVSPTILNLQLLLT